MDAAGFLRAFPGVPAPKRDWLYPIVLVIWGALLWLPGLGSRDLWAPAEPIHGEVVRVMFAQHEWVIPTVNGDLYSDKPILYFWLALLFSKIAGGVNEWTVRLPAALGAIGLVLTTFLLGRTFFDPVSGLLAGVILATTSRLLWDGSFARLDTLHGFFVVLGFYFCLKAFLNRGARSNYLFGYLCFGFAVLTKGLIGIVLPGLTFLLMIALMRRWREIKEMRIFSGAAVVALAVFPWLWLLHLRGADRWLREFILVHHVQNYALRPLGHVRPFYFYFLTLPIDFLPWTIFVPGALLYYYPWRPRLRDPAVLALLCWFGVVLTFFTLSQSKIAYYLIPLLPALALLIGNYVSDLTQSQRDAAHERCTLGAAFIMTGLLFAAGVATPIAARLIDKSLLVVLLPLALWQIVGAAVLFRLLKRHEVGPFVWALSFQIATTFVCVSVFIFPYLNKYNSPRPVAELIRKIVPPAEPVYVFRRTMNDFNFYSVRDVMPILSTVAEVEKLLSRRSNAYLLVSNEDRKDPWFKDKGRVVTENKVGERKWSLVRLSAR